MGLTEINIGGHFEAKRQRDALEIQGTDVEDLLELMGGIGPYI